MKYIVTFIVVLLITIFLLICYIIFLIWDPVKFIKNIKTHAQFDYKDDVMWKETLTDLDYYFKIINLK